MVFVKFRPFGVITNSACDVIFEVIINIEQYFGT